MAILSMRLRLARAEDIILDVARTLQQMRGATRDEQLWALAQIEGGVRAPLYDVTYHAMARLSA